MSEKGEGKGEDENRELRKGIVRVIKLLESDEYVDLETVAYLTGDHYAHHLTRLGRSNGKYQSSKDSMEVDYQLIEQARLQTEGARSNWGMTEDIYTKQFKKYGLPLSTQVDLRENPEEEEDYTDKMFG